MLGSKRFEKIILVLTAVVLVFSLVVVCMPGVFSDVARDVRSSEYPEKFFGTEIVNIEINVDENDWERMLEDKMTKPYIPCNLKINGVEFNEVGIRPKGNSSLTSTNGSRISYRLDFDHYVSNQTCYGLEQMVLNNLQADATYMKDYVAYDLMDYVGVNAPLHTHAFITLNGKPFGVYLAVEVYDEDYLERVYNDTGVMLYSVKSSGMDGFENARVDSDEGTVENVYGMTEAMGMGGPGGPPPPPPMGGPGGPPPMGGPGGQPPMGGPGGQPPMGGQGGQPPMGGPGGQPPMDGSGGQTSANVEAYMGDFGMPPPPPGGMGGGGDLVYVDDLTESYRTIFGNAVSKYADAEDFARVIKAIKYLNKEGVTKEELEQYWNVDGALRYLAAHSFMVNGDSYTGNMMQNYYLAEQNGKITILPWDYNLSFGSFGGGPGGPPGMHNKSSVENGASHNETTKVINYAIDTPTIGVDMADRPLVSVLLGIDEYKERYHQYCKEIAEYASGDFIAKLEIAENAIYPYVEKETEAFYTPEAHKRGFEVLKKFLVLRSRSILGQINGDIPSKTELQTNANLITADFSINEMGSMGGPPGGPGGPGHGEYNMPEPPINNDKNNQYNITYQTTRGAYGQGNMMSPPPGMQDNGNMMPPPPPPGMPMVQQNTANGPISLISLMVLGIVFIFVICFKREY